MQVIRLGEISLGERQRTAPSEGHIRELKRSIIEDGLFHPIVLTKEHRLVAGFCRLTAITQLAQEGITFLHNQRSIEPGTIPFVYVSTIEDRAIFKAELEENLRREDLTPVDRAKAIARLHELYVQQADGPWTQGDTARKLQEQNIYKPNSSAAPIQLSRSLLISRFADDPDVASAPTEKEAYKIARKKTEAVLAQALGMLNLELDTGLLQDRLIEGDFLSSTAELPDDFFDCIIMDPPYGMGANTFGDQSFVLGHQYEDDPDVFLSFLKQLNALHFLRAVKAQAHAYIFMDIRDFFHAKSIIEGPGNWYVWPTPLIWYKGNVGHAPQPDQGPRRAYECILFANRGKRPVLRVGADLLHYPNPTDKIHAAQKPVELYQELISWTCNTGDRILDPCCGSGTVFQAAQKEKANIAWGIEKNPEYANIARSKLR